MRISVSFWGIRCVWLRYFDVFRKTFHFYLATSFLEPVLYLVSFGWGLGSLVGGVEAQGATVDYRTFIFTGIIGQTVVAHSFFEAAYGGFIRMYYQKIFQSMATTPITLSEVLWAELLWDATKSTLSAEVVVLIGVVTGSFAPITLLTLLPLIFFSSFLFAAMGLYVAAKAKNIEQISYPQYLLVYPMLLFCGVFYPIETLPDMIEPFTWILPLTSVVSLARTLALGFPFQWWTLPILACWFVVLVVASRRAMTGRLVK